MSKHSGLLRRSCLPVVSLLAFTLLTLCPETAPAQTVRDDLWVTNGTVYDAKAVGDTLYVGGQFDYAGPATGPFGVAGAETGAVESGWPKINGVVYAVAPDGAGGWYVGGKFSSVGGVTAYNLAHIRADKTLDAAWNPNPSHAPFTDDVKDIEVAGGVVYVCGQFTEVGGQPRKGLAALDPSTGAATAWNPNPSGKVFEVEVIGDRLYVGGAITAVGLSARGGAAAFDLATGALLAWNPAVTGNANNIYTGVHAFAASGNTVFLGGLFTSAGSQARNGLAAVDVTTGAALPWNPNPLDASGAGGRVEALAVDGPTVYVGGKFVEIGGQGVRHLAAVNAVTGAVSTDWAPNPALDEGHLVDYGELHVSRLAVGGGVVYAAGSSSSAARPAAASPRSIRLREPRPPSAPRPSWRRRSRAGACRGRGCCWRWPTTRN